MNIFELLHDYLLGHMIIITRLKYVVVSSTNWYVNFKLTQVYKIIVMLGN